MKVVPTILPGNAQAAKIVTSNLGKRFMLIALLVAVLGGFLALDNPLGSIAKGISVNATASSLVQQVEEAGMHISNDDARHISKLLYSDGPSEAFSAIVTDNDGKQYTMTGNIEKRGIRIIDVQEKKEPIESNSQSSKSGSVMKPIEINISFSPLNLVIVLFVGLFIFGLGLDAYRKNKEKVDKTVEEG